MWFLLACSPDFAASAVVPLSMTGVGLGADVPLVVLNEVMPRNDSTLTHGSLDFPDWIEVYNPSDASLPLSRIGLVHGTDAWAGPAGEVLPARGHVVLYCDSTDGNPTFRLDADGDALTLTLDGTPMDELSWGSVDADVAVARFPDGSTWDHTIRATPGNPNGTAPSASTDPSDLLFETLDVEDVWITLDADAWATLSADRFQKVQGSLAWRGAFFPEVEVTTKGYVGSARGLDQKAGWKVDLNEYADYRMAGVESLTLNNMVQDYSFVHEDLTYRLYRALGVPAPRVGYARVYVNGVQWGLYSNIETPDDTLLARWFEDQSGALYEGAYGVDFYAGSEYSFEYDEGPDPDDRSDLTALITALDQPADDAGLAGVEALVDLDEFLAMMAVEAVALHWDGYTTANNYRVYHDPTSSRFSFLPWGTDQTWKDWWYAPYTGGGRLFLYCMANAACVTRYADQLGAAADAAETLGLEGRMNDLVTVLDPYVQADPRREISVDTWRSYVETTRYYLQTQPATTRAYAAQR